MAKATQTSNATVAKTATRAHSEKLIASLDRVTDRAALEEFVNTCCGEIVVSQGVSGRHARGGRCPLRRSDGSNPTARCSAGAVSWRKIAAYKCEATFTGGTIAA
jgi:hypothetical protein